MMIITDPTKRPSARLFQIIGEYFIPKGFIYKKSLNQFSRTIDNRKETVSVWFNTSINLVSATLSWDITFVTLEKVYKTINMEPPNPFGQTTLWTDLLNYLPRRKDSSDSSFELYDPTSFKYDDFSLNAGAIELIKSYEKYVVPFFEHYKNLEIIAKELNELPLKHHQYIGYGGRHIALGLVLGKLFDKKNFESLQQSYQEYILTDENGSEFKQKMQLYLESSIRYLNAVDIEQIVSKD